MLTVQFSSTSVRVLELKDVHIPRAVLPKRPGKSDLSDRGEACKVPRKLMPNGKETLKVEK